MLRDSVRDPVKDEIKRRMSMFELARDVGTNGRTSCPVLDCAGQFTNRREVVLFEDGWYCHICKTRGDVLDWVMLTEHLDYKGARKKLADLLGIPTTPNKERSALLTIVMLAAHKYLFGEGSRHLEYLESRGISRQLAWKLGLGYLDLGNKVLKETGIPGNQLVALGLLHPPAPGEKAQPAMGGRIIFPIRDTRGRLVQLKGRADPRVLTDPDVKKSLALRAQPDGAPPEWGRVSNQDFMYLEENLPKAKAAGYVVVNEGEPDTATLVGLNFHAVGLQTSSGLAFHAVKFDGIKAIYLMLDNDTASQRHLPDEVLALQAANPESVVYVVMIPPLAGYAQRINPLTQQEETHVVKVDANDLVVKYGWDREGIKTLLESSESAYTFLFKQWGDKLNDPAIRPKLSKLLMKAEPGRKKALFQELSRVTGKTVDMLAFALDPAAYDDIIS